MKDVKLNTELTFESDMKVTITNRYKNWLGNDADSHIGEFSVPVTSLLKHSEKPQFFNILNPEGQFMGQILCNFYLGIFKVDPKTRKIKNYVDPEIIKMDSLFKSTIETSYEVNIDIAIFGVRNLIKKAVQPKMTVRLTNDKENKQEKVIMINEEWRTMMTFESTSNPNFSHIL